MRMVCGVGALAALCSVASAGDVLASFLVNVEGRFVDGDFALRPFLALSDATLPNPSGYVEGPTLTLLSFFNGVQSLLAGETGAVFGEFTNGLDAEFFFGVVNDTDGATTQASLLESVAFAGVNGATPPDLAGFTIDRIDALGTAFQSFGETFTATVEFTVYGEVPAPASASALALGAFGAMRRRRR